MESYKRLCRERGVPSHPVVVNADALHYEFGVLQGKFDPATRSGVANSLKKRLQLVAEDLGQPGSGFLRVRCLFHCAHACWSIPQRLLGDALPLQEPAPAQDRVLLHPDFRLTEEELKRRQRGIVPLAPCQAPALSAIHAFGSVIGHIACPTCGTRTKGAVCKQCTTAGRNAGSAAGVAVGDLLRSALLMKINKGFYERETVKRTGSDVSCMSAYSRKTDNVLCCCVCKIRDVRTSDHQHSSEFRVSDIVAVCCERTCVCGFVTLRLFCVQGTRRAIANRWPRLAAIKFSFSADSTQPMLEIETIGAAAAPDVREYVRKVAMEVRSHIQRMVDNNEVSGLCIVVVMHMRARCRSLSVVPRLSVYYTNVFINGLVIVYPLSIALVNV